MNKIKSLTLKLICMVLIAATLGGLVFLVVYQGADYFLNKRIEKSTYKNEVYEYAVDFQNYVLENNLSMEDEEEIFKWTKRGNFLYLILYKNGHVIFDSLGEPPEDGEPNILEENEWTTYYNIEFCDGVAQAFILIAPGYKYYILTLIAGIILGLMVFLFTFIYWVNKEITYIKKLSEYVKLMEGGPIDQSIDIRGVDELSDLATGLEQMRLSLIENIETEKNLTLANQNLVAGMSHDLRTPLTSLIMYLEILRGTKQSHEQSLYYLDKSYNKAMHIKELSDQLFEFFLISKEAKSNKSVPVKIKDALHDYLSEMALVLSQKEFSVEVNLEWWNAEISIRFDFLERIMDNITSNILKYADAEAPILIKTSYTPTTIAVIFSNKIKTSDETAESAKVGVTNICLMMDKMGRCEINESADVYETKLIFDIMPKS